MHDLFFVQWLNVYQRNAMSAVELPYGPLPSEFAVWTLEHKEEMFKQFLIFKKVFSFFNF